MAIFIKNDEQTNHIRLACKIVAETHELLEKHVRPGITTKELDKIAEEYIRSKGAVPSFKGYNGFPLSICVAINDEVIHGIPGLRKLKSGDIIGIDIGAYINGFHGDAARTHPVGDVSEDSLNLIKVTRESFFKSMEFAKQGCHLHQISASIQEYVESFGYSVVRDYVGHGIGKQMHEAPQIPHYKMPSRGPRLSKGMTLCIEPMINAGTYEVKLQKDNWTVVTRDGKNSAHYENTVLITDGEPEILTL